MKNLTYVSLIALIGLLSSCTSNIDYAARNKHINDSIANAIHIENKKDSALVGGFLRIGPQVWTTQNLDVKTFSNGDPIPQANTDDEWIKAGKEEKPAWCYYNYDSNSEIPYGKLYNGFAVNDKRGLAPKGWHIPSNKEWFTLFNNTDAMKEVRGGDRLKEKWGWVSSMNGNNKSGLSVLPSGNRWTMGAFYAVGKSAFFWTSTDGSYFEITTSGNIINMVQYPTYGMACRCVKD